MSKEKELSRSEISRRIVAGMGIAYDLFNEMNSFLRMLVEAGSVKNLSHFLMRWPA